MTNFSLGEVSPIAKTNALALLAGGIALVLGLAAGAQSTDLKLDAAGERVNSTLLQVINNVVTSPNGQLKIVVKPNARAEAGYFDEVDIEGSPVLIKHLHVSDFKLVSHHVRVDVPFLLDQKKVNTLEAETTLRAVITEDDLTSMLAEGKSTADMNLKVKYVGQQISVTGELHWGLITGPISGLGKMRLAPGHQVFLDILSLKLRGVEVPQFLKDKFSDHINPVIDYNDLPFNPPFKGVVVEGPKAIITA